MGLYKRGPLGYARLLAGGVRDWARASRAVIGLAHVDQVRIDEHRRALATEAATRLELERAKAELTNLHAKAVLAEAAVAKSMADRTRLIADLGRRRQMASEYVQELEGARLKLQATMAGLGATPVVDLPLRPFRGALDWPVGGRIVSRFGRNTDRFGTAVIRNGIEIAAPAGTRVQAVHGGTVAYAAPFSGFGILVIVDHGGNDFSLYGALSATGPAARHDREARRPHRDLGRDPDRRERHLFRAAHRRSPGQSPRMAQELLMTSRRFVVLAISVPIVAFAVIGGFMGNGDRRGGESYPALRIFEDVVTLILNNYVEEVDVDKVMHGAMHGLADGLDPDSAYLNVEQVKLFEKGVPANAAAPGLEFTRQYYLRVIAARDGSPAAKAGLRPGDYIRAIDGQSTRDTSVYEGAAPAARQAGHQGEAHGAARQRRRAARGRSRRARSCRRCR